MGTNFYWTPRMADQLGITPSEYGCGDHLGKRSAAGLYCWDCRRTLCVEGEARIHYGAVRWYRQCPVCSAVPIRIRDEIPFAVAVELGFAEAAEAPPTGVSTCSSFNWGIDPETVRRICRENADKKIVRDEYGDLFTGQQFLHMLEANCPIEFTHFIGTRFS